MYSPNLPGIDEARLYAYENLFVSHLNLLNAAFGRDHLSAMGTITPAMVEVGDSEEGWDIATGSLRIRIVAGGEANGQDFEAHPAQGLSYNTGWRYEFSTNVYVYMHPHTMANKDYVQQARDREIARSRIADWITFGVCNYWDPMTDTGGALLTLQSRIFTPPPGTDPLLEAMVRRAYKSWVSRSFGGEVAFPCLHLVCTANIQ